MNRSQVLRGMLAGIGILLDDERPTYAAPEPGSDADEESPQNRDKIRDILALVVGGDELDWMTASCPSVEHARAERRRRMGDNDWLRTCGKSGSENPDHANAVGGAHVRSGASPATGNVAEVQDSTEGSSASSIRMLEPNYEPRGPG